MPFFLFADAILVGAVLLTWLTLSGFGLQPARDAALAALLGAHGLMVLAALYKRNRVDMSWLAPRRYVRGLPLTLLLILVAHAYLLAPAITTLRLADTVPEHAPSVRELAPAVHAGILFCWMLGGFGAAALCFGVLCLELERSGSRQMAVYIGASGYALLFVGQSLYYLLRAPEEPGHDLRAITIMMDRWLIAFTAGYLFIATRHLLCAGMLLGVHEWLMRYVLNEVKNSAFAPLIALEASNQKLYWLARLASAAAALALAIYAYRRAEARGEALVLAAPANRLPTRPALPEDE